MNILINTTLKYYITTVKSYKPWNYPGLKVKWLEYMSWFKLVRVYKFWVEKEFIGIEYIKEKKRTYPFEG